MLALLQTTYCQDHVLGGSSAVHACESRVCSELESYVQPNDECTTTAALHSHAKRLDCMRAAFTEVACVCGMIIHNNNMLAHTTSWNLTWQWYYNGKDKLLKQCAAHLHPHVSG